MSIVALSLSIWKLSEEISLAGVDNHFTSTQLILNCAE